MLDLNDFHLFVSVVDQGGFTAAGRRLDVPKSTLSQRIARLEDDLGTRLLSRTSRHVGVTEAGRDFYAHAVEVLRGAEMAEAAVRKRVSEPCGTVRVTASLAAMRYVLNDVIADFLVQHPKVQIVAHATDAMVDLVAAGLDVAIRGHSAPLPSSDLVQRTIMRQDYRLVAGIDYLAAFGEPDHPEQLAEHRSLLMTRGGGPAEWRLHHRGGAREDVVVKLTPRLMSDDVCGLQRAAIAGLGIVALPEFTFSEAVRAGTLRVVLPEWTAGTGTMTALTPCRRGMLPSVRAFLDHVGAEIPRRVAERPAAACSRTGARVQSRHS